jgi:peptidoglycan/LPS O-acetylase OafA/YrhL
MKSFNDRLTELDFLRGIAVILVLFAHHYLTIYTATMGWIGVDLFFVLSGFLVSGLLFAEYQKFGNIDTKRFLIRRGFKIYPAFYFSVFVTLFLLHFLPNFSISPSAHLLILNDNGLIIGLVIEVFFLQSYFFGFWGHHWSLAVEEHFYLLLVTLIWFLIVRKKLNHRVFLRIGICIFVTCLLLRIITNLYTSNIATFTATHLRIDSLFVGVVIAYFYHFEYERLKEFYQKYRIVFFALIIPLLSFTPFVDVLDSYFVRTVGFSLIAAAFGLLLLVFLFEDNINAKVSRIIGRRPYEFIARKVGFYSYGIYLFHMYIVRYLVGEGYAEAKYRSGEWGWGWVALSFGLYFVFSINLGIVLSKVIERPFLLMRDKYFPRRSLPTNADAIFIVNRTPSMVSVE